MNVKLLRKVAKHILQEPRRFIMSTWRAKGEPGTPLDDYYPKHKFPECGTAACIGGWAASLAGKDVYGCNLQKLLGITGVEADRLFYRSGWPKQFRKKFKEDGSMRLTLEQLRAMSDTELRRHWREGRFPFEFASCGQCLTSHVAAKCHPEIAAQLNAMGHDKHTDVGDIEVYVSKLLREHLDEFYALRLFYDSLYPPSAESAQPAERIEPCTSNLTLSPALSAEDSDISAT